MQWVQARRHGSDEAKGIRIAGPPKYLHAFQSREFRIIRQNMQIEKLCNLKYKSNRNKSHLRN